MRYPSGASVESIEQPWPASTVFTEPEIETLEVLVPTLEGKTERQKNPHPTRGLARACWVVARLGRLELLL